MKALLTVVSVAVLVGTGVWGWHYRTVGRFIQETNNAYVQADQVTVSPQVMGYVASVLVSANQVVTAGQPLLTIDDGHYRDKLVEQQAGVDLKPSSAVPAPPTTLAVGDPASMLRRRPDIGRWERQIAAANAQIEQSVSQLSPRIDLIGNAGWVSPNIGSIGLLAASIYSVGPTLSWTSLDFGRTLAQIRQSEAGADEALAPYERTVLQAMQDAETSLSRFGHRRATIARLARASASAGKVSMLADQRNTAGTISTIDVLDVERQRLQADQSLAQAQAEHTNNVVAVQKRRGLVWGLPDKRVAMIQQ